MGLLQMLNTPNDKPIIFLYPKLVTEWYRGQATTHSIILNNKMPDRLFSSPPSFSHQILSVFPTKCPSKLCLHFCCHSSHLILSVMVQWRFVWFLSFNLGFFCWPVILISIVFLSLNLQTLFPCIVPSDSSQLSGAAIDCFRPSMSGPSLSTIPVLS